MVTVKKLKNTKRFVLDTKDSTNAGRIWVRLAFFIIAVIVSLLAIGTGVNQLITKKPGFYQIAVDPEETVPFFQNDIEYYVWLEGSNSQIKAQQRELTRLYRQYALRSYQLLDETVEYPGFTNLATINAHLGETLAVSPDLFTVLQDLWTKTQDMQGVNLFAGAYMHEYDTILAQSDISGFEPDGDNYTHERLISLAEHTADISQFSAVFDEKTVSVCFSITPEYQDFLLEMECSGPVITAGFLKDAYRLDMIRNGLAASGITTGYLVSNSGLTLPLSNDGGVTVSYLRTFPKESVECMYHIVDSTRYHPNYKMTDASMNQYISSSTVTGVLSDIVETCYRNIQLFQTDNENQLKEFAKDFPEGYSASIVYRTDYGAK